MYKTPDALGRGCDAFSLRRRDKKGIQITASDTVSNLIKGAISFVEERAFYYLLNELFYCGNLNLILCVIGLVIVSLCNFIVFCMCGVDAE